MWRKFKADRIFDGSEFLAADKVVICNKAGKIEDIVTVENAGDDILSLEGIIAPGFINCHCHLELSHMKGLIPQKTGLVDFVFAVVMQRHFPEEEILNAIDSAEKEMIQNGIVAVGDICNNLSTLTQKSKANIFYYNFIETSGWNPAVANIRFEKSKIFFDSYNQTGPSTIVPHAAYSVSDNLWKLIQPYFKNKTATIHNQETISEDELFTSKTGDFTRMYQMMNIDNSFFVPTGKSSLQSYFTKLEGATHTILVHNTFTALSDIVFIQNTRNNSDVSFCLCPNANLYIENTLPPVDMLMKKNCNIVLGTDSLASNHQLSLLSEMKTIQLNFKAVSLEQLLQWGTKNGAAALQINDRYGTIEKGKQPGLVLLENIDNDTISGNTRIKRLI